MHSAPATRFLVTQSRWHLHTIVVLGMLALVCTTSFVLAQQRLAWRTLLPVALTPLALGLAVRAWRQAAQGSLQWDGEQWFWSGFPAPQACHVALLMDFQQVLLVALTMPSQKTVYLWLEAAMDATQWKALRRALVSSRGMAPLGGDNTGGTASGVAS